MDAVKTSEEIDHDRRRLLGTAAMGIAVVGARGYSRHNWLLCPQTMLFVRSASTYRTNNSPISAGASPSRDGPTGRR